MERKVKNLTASLAQTAEGLVQQAEMSLAEVNRRLGGINYQSAQLPADERRLVNIERKFKLSDNLYNYLMEKRAEAGIAIASDQVDKTVVDTAQHTWPQAGFAEQVACLRRCFCHRPAPCRSALF